MTCIANFAHDDSWQMCSYILTEAKLCKRRYFSKKQDKKKKEEEEEIRTGKKRKEKEKVKAQNKTQQTTNKIKTKFLRLTHLQLLPLVSSTMCHIKLFEYYPTNT